MHLIQNSLHHQVANTLREQMFASVLAPGLFLDADLLELGALRELARSQRSRFAL